MIHIVLFQPENAGNLGNIIRSCAIFQAQLHLIRPYGWIGNLRYFYNPQGEWKNAELLRSTVGCLTAIVVHEHNSWSDFQLYCAQMQQPTILYFTKHEAIGFQTYQAQHPWSDLTSLFLVFGSETFGLTKLLATDPLNPRIALEPLNATRCYNLANAVAIALYACNYWQQNN